MIEGNPEFRSARGTLAEQNPECLSRARLGCLSHGAGHDFLQRRHAVAEVDGRAHGIFEPAIEVAKADGPFPVGIELRLHRGLQVVEDPGTTLPGLEKPAPKAAEEAPAKLEREEYQSAPDDLYSNLMGDAPACSTCGHTTVRNGACYRCLNCGNSMGCS